MPVKQFFKIWRLRHGENREKANEEIMDKIKDGWLIKQMEHIPSAKEGSTVVFATSIAVLFEKEEKEENDGRD